MSNFTDRITSAFSKLWNDDGKVLEDNEMLESGFSQTVGSKSSDINDFQESTFEFSEDKIEDKAEPLILSEASEPAVTEKAADVRSLYAHQNAYTGKNGYEDNDNVTFTAAKGSEFRSGTVVNYAFSHADEVTKPEPTKRNQPKSETASRTMADEPAKPAAEPARQRAPMGFNTNSTVNVSNSASPNSTIKINKTAGGNSDMEKLNVQILRPVSVDDVEEACSLLKKGVEVIAVLNGIADKNARLRYFDYLSGCCKGCDADFTVIVPVESSDTVLIAAPSNVNLKQPEPKKEAEPKKEEIEAQPSFKTAQPKVSSNLFSEDLFKTTNFYK